MPNLIDIFGGHFMSDVPDPYPAYARLRRQEPVALLDLPMGPAFFVSRYADVLAVLRDNTLFSSRANADGIGMVMGRTILEMDGKEHSRHRAIVAPVFVPKALTGELHQVVASIAHQMIDGFVRNGRSDLVEEFTKTYPLRVIAHIIGLPIEDYDTFQRWALAISGMGSNLTAAVEAAGQMTERLKPIVNLSKTDPRDDLMSKLVHARVDGRGLTDEEVYSFLRVLIPAGAETTYRLIGNTLLALLLHPEQFEEVSADRSKIGWAIDEALRWEAPVCFAARETAGATMLAGVEIPSKRGILVAIASANRDDAAFSDPNRFDINRRRDDHLAFGGGRHFCVGSHLARLEATTAIDALLDRLHNLRLDPASDTGVYGLAFRSPKEIRVRFDP